MIHDALRAVSELAASQHGVFTRQQAAQHGCTKARVRRLLDQGLLTEPKRGVLVIAGAPVTWHQRLAVSTAPAGIVATHRAAARLFRLDGCRESDLLEVSCAWAAQSGDAIVHRRNLPPGDLVRIASIPCTNLARTLTDLGDVVPVDLVERALDDARRRGASLRWVRDTAERLHRPGVSGPRIILGLLDALQPSEALRDSWFESLIERIVSNSTLPAIERQFELKESCGKHVARFDLAMPSIRLGIEAHSREFHFGREAETRDEDRDHRVAMCGWDTMYLGWQSAHRPAQTLERVRLVVAGRSRSLGEQ